MTRGRRIALAVAGLVAAAVLAVAATAGRDALAAMRVGTAGMAKIACGCVYVANRPLADCRKDDPPGFETIPVDLDRETKSARGSLWPVSSRATYTPGFGCTLD